MRARSDYLSRRPRRHAKRAKASMDILAAARLDALGQAIGARCAAQGWADLAELIGALATSRSGQHALWTRTTLAADLDALADRGDVAVGAIGEHVIVLAWPVPAAPSAAEGQEPHGHAQFAEDDRSATPDEGSPGHTGGT